MIEIVVKEYLNAMMTVPAYTEIPKTKPERYLLIEKAGGGSENFLQNAMITIQSYAPSLSQAAHLNEEVKKVMQNIVTRNEVSGCRLNTDYNFTDTSKKGHRYQAVFDISYY